ncbi:carbohydrate ABC transporter permease [Cellulomonas sp.]|uniref:carbohydrate ABC transporter permease n=1 Tax=Cellulomonas sp. TaxID=40001 RepID=UPI003BA93283
MANAVSDIDVGTKAVTTRERIKPRKHFPRGLLWLLPSFLIVAVFVYVFIAYTVGVSLSANWRAAQPDMTVGSPWYENYRQLANSGRFQADVRNNLVFTFFFLILAVGMGFVFAVLVHNALRAKGFFRAVFMLPYALSFIVTGVVWRWLFNPESGLNLLLQYSGLSTVYEKATGVPLQPEWTSSATVVGDLSGLLNTVIPGGDFIQVKLGVPLALMAVVLAASWQLMGFSMAMFLAGLSSIPEEILEAAQMDGASGYRYYKSIVVPLMAPFAVTALVILAHVAFKMFDLIYAMSGSGVGFATDMPGIFVYETIYKALRPNLGAAAAVVMLLMVCAVVLPYLIRTGRRDAHD